MNDVLPPESFSEFWGIWLFYVISFGFVSLIFIYPFLGLGVLAFTALRKEMPKLRKRLFRLGAFLLILAPVGGLFNAFWCCLVYGNLYAQEIGKDGTVLDVDSPEDDFTPFFPPSHEWLAGLPGHLVGVTMPQLQLVWLFFAATAWAISFILYRLIRQQIAKLILRLAQDDGKLEMKIPLIPKIP
jgi:hypothetical protein